MKNNRFSKWAEYLVLEKVIFYSSWLMWSSHLFHKYNWRHVIDTILQLNMIVNVGIKLKSISLRSKAQLKSVLCRYLVNSMQNQAQSTNWHAAIDLLANPDLDDMTGCHGEDKWSHGVWLGTFRICQKSVRTY